MVVGCQPYAPAAFTPTKYSWYSFLLEAESTPGPQCDQKDFMSMKNSMTPAGIEPATFRSVAQHLNHCAAAVPVTNAVQGNVVCSEIHTKHINTLSGQNVEFFNIKSGGMQVTAWL